MAKQEWPKSRSMVGLRFVRLLIVGSLGCVPARTGIPRLRLLAECDCGNKVEVDAGRVKSGSCRSCGCLRTERILSYLPVPILTFEDMIRRSTVDARTGCVLWGLSVVEKGYGMAQYRGKQRGAHRVSWMIHHGTIPPGIEVMHTCDAFYEKGDKTSRRCINPNHLQLGSHQENMDHMVALGRSNSGWATGARSQ